MLFSSAREDETENGDSDEHDYEPWPLTEIEEDGLEDFASYG